MTQPKDPKGFLVVLPGEIIEIPQDSDKSWLTLFYSLPKELAEKWKPAFDLPRCPYEVLRTDKYDSIVCDDAQKQLRQYQNREKVLTRKLFVEERRIRTHRLCARGGYLESIVPELIAMTDEEAKDYLYHAVHSEEAKAFLKKRAEGGVTE